MVAIENDICRILVQLCGPITEGSILVEMLELQEFGEVDKEGQEHHKDEVQGGVGLVFQRMADGVIPGEQKTQT